MIQYQVNETLSEKQRNEVFSFLIKNASSLLQYPEWIEMSQPGRKVLYIIAYNEVEIICFALVSVKFWHGIILFGPVCKDQKIIPQFLADTAKLIQKKGIGLLSVIKFLSDEIKDDLHSSFNDRYNVANKECISPWATILIDLSLNEDMLFSHFSSNHKRAIKKANQYGFTVREIEKEEDVIGFSKLYLEMYQKRKIIMPVGDPAIMFLSIYRFFKEKSLGSFWGVYDKGVLIGGIVVGYQGDIVFYHYGASDKKIHKKPVMHILFYEVMKVLKNRNFAVFDLGGYALNCESDKQLININRFKSGFGGKIVYYGYPMNFILSKPKYFYIIYVINNLKKLFTFLKKRI